MLERFLGEAQFQRGMVAYIKKYASANADTEDLWRTLTEVTGVDVRSLMQSWTKQTGFPLLQVEEPTTAADGSLVFAVKQNRFLQTGPDATSASTWPVPIDFVVAGQAVGDKPLGKQVFADRAGSITVNTASVGIAAPKWIKLNSAQASMYRVAYPPKMYAALCQAVADRDPLLTSADRLGVQNDAFALTRCGLITTVQLLELVKSYENETGKRR